MDLNKQQWINIGDEKFCDKKFEIIKNSNYQNKPSGGLWFSKYNGDNNNICEWLNYIQDQTAEYGEYCDLYTRAMYYKVGSIIQLKEDANIALIDRNSIESFIRNYSLNEISLDYEKISKVYDALYLELFNLPSKYWSGYRNNLFNFKSWSVSTLLLFNYNIININEVIGIDVNSNLKGALSFSINRSKVYRKG